MIRNTYWRIADWMYLHWLDFDYWRETRRRSKALRKWTDAQDWERLK